MDAKAWMREALMTGVFALYNEISADELASAAQRALRRPQRDMRSLRSDAAVLIAQLRVRPPALSDEEVECPPKKRSKQRAP